eukprot:1176401-Rhodomonas_salina.1
MRGCTRSPPADSKADPDDAGSRLTGDGCGCRRHDFGSFGEAGGKGGEEKGWGSRAVSMNKLPKPMTLNRQKYRHVDRVEIESHEILDRCELRGWLRMCWLSEADDAESRTKEAEHTGLLERRSEDRESR